MPAHHPAPQPPRTLLLTGFEPFGGESVNPSWLVAQALHGQQLGDAVVQAVCLPCVFGQAADALRAAMRRHRPLLVVALGQAAGREGLTVERVAINVDDARIADNAGRRPIDVAVRAGGPAAYFSTLPIKAMVAALNEHGIAGSVSQTAGTFVCNHVFYALMHLLKRRGGTAVRGGFVHVPLLPGQLLPGDTRPSLPLAVQVQGVRLLLQTALATQHDLRASGGAVS